MKPRYFFAHDLIPGGLSLRLMERRWMSKPEPISVDNWSDCMADQAFSGVSKILALADDDASDVHRIGDGLFVDHKTVASLSEPQSASLELPPSIPFALQIETKNLITD